MIIFIKMLLIGPVACVVLCYPVLMFLPIMAISVSVQYIGGVLSGIILLAVCMYVCMYDHHI